VRDAVDDVMNDRLAGHVVVDSIGTQSEVFTNRRFDDCPPPGVKLGGETHDHEDFFPFWVVEQGGIKGVQVQRNLLAGGSHWRRQGTWTKWS